MSYPDMYALRPGGIMEKTQKIRVCPRCGSSQIREAKTSVSGWLVPKTYYCSDEECGYSGPVFVEVEADEADKFKRAINGDK
jgi:predicted RNA-binding Zn-ribbon protein involved in translation (DUF1610 family)